MGSGKHILLAEDDPNDVTLLKQALLCANLSHVIHHVPHGRAAIDYIMGKEPYSDRALHPFPDLLVIDLKMPYMDGFEVLEFLMNWPGKREVPVLVFSSSSIEQDIQRAISLGAASYLVKPVSFDDYIEIARELDLRWLGGSDAPRAIS